MLMVANELSNEAMLLNFSVREKCPNTRKYGLEKTPYLDTFHTVLDTLI